MSAAHLAAPRPTVTGPVAGGVPVGGPCRRTAPRGDRARGTRPVPRARGGRARWSIKEDSSDPRERGSSIVELVIVTPLVLLLLGMIVQATVWAHAEHIAQAAAARGTEAARASGSTARAGDDQARTTLDALGGALRDPTIQVTRTATTTRTQIHGTALAVLPGVHLPVHAAAEAPTERFVPDTDTDAATGTGGTP